MAFLISARHWRNGGRVVVSAACALLLFGGLNLAAEPVATKEYQVKAVFLFNFSQFVEWPTNALPETQAPLIIGVLGDNPFGAYLEETVRGEQVNNHPLVIQHYHRIEDIKECHILFISQSETGRLNQILASLKGRNILTVSESESFAKSGGMIRFVTEKNKIHLRINVAAAKAANLTISSKLLKLAEIVSAGKD